MKGPDRSRTFPRRMIFLASLLVGALATSASAQEQTVALDPEHTAIKFTLGDVLHTVHGTFQLKSGTIRLNPATGAASGLVVVDVTSGDTGSKSRDRKMHKDILESSQYPDATFIPTGVSGASTLSDRQTYQISGIFRLHGADHPVTLTFPLTLNGTSVAAHTHLVIPYVKWGLKNPSTFVLRVSDKLDLDIEANGQLVQTSAQSEIKK